VVNELISNHIPPQSLLEQWDVPGLEQLLKVDFGIDLPIAQWLEEDKKLYEEPLRVKIIAAMDAVYEEKCSRLGMVMRGLEKQIMLHVLDTLWKEHLQGMDQLRQGIGLRAYAQKNPKQEYKREAFELFNQLLTSHKHDVTRVLFKVEPMTEEQMHMLEARRQMEAEVAMRNQRLQHDEVSALQPEPASAQEPAPAQPSTRLTPKIGRNDPCPCGSGKKFKACHGKLD
jgi:preprotein translocase subunit SecA